MILDADEPARKRSAAALAVVRALVEAEVHLKVDDLALQTAEDGLESLVYDGDRRPPLSGPMIP